jgi:SAM-dependent methyltransferase
MAHAVKEGRRMNAIVETKAEPLKLDLGCGKNKKAGFKGVDALSLDGVDCVHDLRVIPWPWADDSVDEVHCSHFVEHLTNLDGRFERVHFFNELHRVLKKGAKALLIFPHWCSARFYGDPTHKEPFSEFGFYYLSKDWRAGNAPHADRAHSVDGYDCDFDATWGYSMHASLSVRNAEYQQHAMQFWKEACQDIHATLTKK